MSLAIAQREGTLVVDSRLIAQELGIEHRSLFRTVKKYQTELQQGFGILQFALGEISSCGRPEKYALLTEPQAKFLLSKSRNGLTSDSISKFKEIGFDFSDFPHTTTNRRKRKESDYSNDLCKDLNGKREVVTLAGNIDVLTQTEIIEVKTVSLWKAALGQVLVYGHYYPSHQKRIHLYGETQESFLKMVQSHCKKFNVIVTWEA